MRYVILLVALAGAVVSALALQVHYSTATGAVFRSTGGGTAAL